MKFILFSFLLLSVSVLFSQQISPKQINWPLITGSGSPASTSTICSATNYGQSYQDVSVMPNPRYHCGTDGWELEFSNVPAGVEYLRPTVDANNPTLVGNITGTCNGEGFNEFATGSLSTAYSGKSGIGPVGSSASQSINGLDTLPGYVGSYTSRIFSTWQSTSNTYTSLVLNVTASTSGTSGTGSWLAWSTDGGVTWNYDTVHGGPLFSTLTTRSFTVTGTSLSNLQVAVCAEANGTASSDSTTNTIKDIWTTGTFGGNAIQVTLLQPSIIYSAAVTPLPTCSLSLKGTRAVVSDATSPTFGSTYTGGGTITRAVICSYNGSSYNWIY